jgi:hypothetical protein
MNLNSFPLLFFETEREAAPLKPPKKKAASLFLEF